MTNKEKIKLFIPYFFLSFYHYLLAFLGALFCGFPGNSKNLRIIGVTGTSGKSTTVDFITRILDEAGYKTASISSIRFKVKEKQWKNKYKMTMPGRFVIQKFLKQAKKEKCQYVVLEVTSEGIKQHRHRFIKFHTALFTNLSLEHIESHGSFENYRKAKEKLFKTTKDIHIINIDDENSKYFQKIPSKEKWGYGCLPSSISDLKTVNAEKIEILDNEVRFSVKNVEFSLKMFGKFNVYNALSSICTGLAYNVSLDVCKMALEKVKGIEGRMEIVAKNPFTVIVDYAHTPKQLEEAYKSLGNKDLICVLGSCGGGRDKRKRPILGEIASKYCKEVIITNEDPYDEDPLTIIEEVASGTKGKGRKILDRKKAIEEAISVAKPNDTVIITGKGCEIWMCVAKGRKIPWDDRKIAREHLLKLQSLK